jgi:hypothetical protein
LAARVVAASIEKMFTREICIPLLQPSVCGGV